MSVEHFRGNPCPSDRYYYLIGKLSDAKIIYNNSIALMNFRLNNRKMRKSLVERGVVRFAVEKDGFTVGVYVYGHLVSLNHYTPKRKVIDSIFDTVMAMEEHCGKEQI